MKPFMEESGCYICLVMKGCERNKAESSGNAKARRMIRLRRKIVSFDFVMKKIVFCLLIFLASNANAQQWHPVSLNFLSSDYIGAMAVDSLSNTLIVGGRFDSIGSVQSKNIARWNGYNFLPIGLGLNIEVNSMVVINDEIYAASEYGFDYDIYKWDGINWNIFATANNHVNSMKARNGKLYVAGSFTTIGGTFARRIAVWDGTTWSEVGGGITEPLCCAFLFTMEFLDSVLYVTGEFDKADTVLVENIVGWNGTNWFPLGSGVSNEYPGFPVVLKAYNNELYVGGGFDTAGGLFCNNIARWNGLTWDTVGNGLTPGSGYSLLVFNNKLYASGGDNSGNEYVGRVPSWNGTQWNMTGDGNINSNLLEGYNNEIYSGLYSVNIFGGDTVWALARFGQLDIQSQGTNCITNCNGTATITDSVGVSPHTYLWSNGATTKTVVGLCAGVYFVSVTDGSGSVTEGTVTIEAPPAITFNDSINNAGCATCNDGSIDINATGGTPPFTYQWNNGASTDTISNLSYGNYYLTITDTSNCSFADTFHVSYSNTIQTQATIIKCYGECTGTATATTDGVQPFIYECDNSDTAQTISNLCTGTYIITVTDSNGVAVTDTIVIDALPQIVFTDTSTNATCPTCTDGSATINNTSGGTPPYKLFMEQRRNNKCN